MPALGQFVDSVPYPLTLSLLNLAPLLSIAAHITRLATWQLDSYSSWLTLAAWWLFCLAAPPLFRYLLPLVLVLAFIFYPPSHSTPLVTESILQNAIVDFNTLSTPLPSLPPLSLPPFALLRAAAILTLPWLFITHLIPTRIIFAVIGSLVLIHRAPWALVLRSVLWRSAFVRAILHRIQALLTGQNLPKYVVSNHPTQTTPQPASSLRFLFTIYENQRWWMGLDWTAALLPSERPSWCSPSLHPLSPPNAFTLPDPITIYLPSPDAKSRIKRTAIWKWEEPEWRLLIRKEGTSLSRIERPPPAIDDSSPLSPSSSATSSGGSRLLKAAAIKFKESSTSSPQSSSSTTTSPPADIDPASDQDDSVEPFTDPDGWIYADNKWENQSHRGGLGKYTRHRRWTRVAIVTEIVQVIEPGQLGVQHPSSPPASIQQQPTSMPISPVKSTFSDSKTQSPEPPLVPPTPSSSSSAISTPDPESPLRQRLRAALSKSSIPSSS